MVRVEKHAIVLSRFEVEDCEVAGAFVIGLSQGVRRVVACMSLWEAERAVGICCDVEEDIAEADVIFVGSLSAAEIGAFHFQSQIWFEIYSAAFDAIAV